MAIAGVAKGMLASGSMLGPQGLMLAVPAAPLGPILLAGFGCLAFYSLWKARMAQDVQDEYDLDLVEAPIET